MLAGLQAGAQGVPFMPVRGVLGTDYLTVRSDFKVMRNPYGDDDIVIVPAINPALAVFHAFRADEEGNVAFDNRQHSWLLAQASESVVVTVEEIVEHGKLVRTPLDAVVGYIHVDAVVVAPGGAHPTGCDGYYGSDRTHIRDYMRAAASDQSFRAYLDSYVGIAEPSYIARVRTPSREEAKI